MNFSRLSFEHSSFIYSERRKMNRENYQEVLSEIYKFAKSITDNYYVDNKMHEAFKEIDNAIIYAESESNNIFNEKILDVRMNYDMFDKPNDTLKYLVYSARKYLIEQHFRYGYNRNIQEIDFTDDCEKASIYIRDFCEDNNIKCYMLPIYPGYDRSRDLYGGAGYHYANIVEYQNKYYLVDVTYSQFFYGKKNNLDRIGIVGLSGCSVGMFMLMSNKGKEIATTLLREGYIEINEEVLKTYLDAFTISFRNGLYYESTNDFSYTTPYTIDDYISFLEGNNSQIICEGKENLGYQRRPLKKWDLDFKRR